MGSRHPLPYAFAKANTLLLEDDGRELTLWAGEHASPTALSEVRASTRSSASSASRSARWRSASRRRTPAAKSSAAAVVGEVESAVDLSRMMQDLPAVEDLLEAANDAPIIRMLNALLTQAAKDGASDIHIEPYERNSSVRFRVDGTLREVVEPNRALHAALISRLKIMAELDISEKRLPQDGRISLRIGGRAIDVRVSTLPNAHGERAVLRLLDKGEAKFTLESLGMSGNVLTKFKQLVQQPHGIVLVTGPTGSRQDDDALRRPADAGNQHHQRADGRRPDRVRTARHRPDAGQRPHRPDVCQGPALDPAPGPGRDHDRRDPRLRNRADRDPGLADRPPGAGHGAHQRRAVVGDAADRHGRRALPAQQLRCSACWRSAWCASCAPPARSATTAAAATPSAAKTAARTGYKGRTGVYELMTADDKVRALIHSRAAESQLFVAAENAGLKPMREDGERLVVEGVTSPEEVMRVTRE